MNVKRGGSALVISVALHGLAALVLGVYLVTQTEAFKDLIGAEVVQVKEPPKPKVRKPIIKPVIKPSIPTTNTVVVEQVQVQPRVTTAAVVRPTTIQTQTVLEFANKPIRVNAPINPNVPRVITNTQPQVVTHTNLPPSDAPGALAFSGPVAAAPAGLPGGIARGIGGAVQVKAGVFARPAGLAMVKEVGVERDVLGDVVKDIGLGDLEVPPLERGEPGGRVIGRGRDIRGVLRFTRIRHSLSDWWADASSLNALTKWLNERTKIKADMNVEGGAVKLTDANLMKCPIVCMTGHDPALTRSRNLMGRQYGGGKLDSRFSDTEASNLRKYLVERGGVLTFDDCGVNAPAQAMIRLFLAQMRYVMPEFQIERIANDHDIYNNFYEMGGPPVGFDIFWWGTRPPKRNYLEGISVGDKLSVLIFRRDYMCAMESVSLPTRSVHYSPGVYRFMTNVVVYSLTTGKISDHSGYIPTDRLAAQALPESAPQAAKITATGQDHQ